MSRQLLVGTITFALGAVLLWSARREAESVPRWVPRLAGGVTALGLSTIVATRAGLWWSVASIACSLVAIVQLLRVIVETLRR